MRLRRIICFSLAAIMILSLVGCDSSKKTAANETESKYIIDENPLAFVSDNEVKFVKQKDGFVKVYDKSELDKNSGTIIEIDSKTAKQKIDGYARGRRRFRTRTF